VNRPDIAGRGWDRLGLLTVSLSDGRRHDGSVPSSATRHVPIGASRVWIDGNQAAARVAYALSEVIAIYPITPSSPMGEHADAWSAQRRPNLWGAVPEIVEMQSEGGAAGALHGALQAGAAATTFTASQGLLLMLPNMFKIAGELTPAVIHVAARAVATHALSIFGDHSDVMAARTTGWAMLCASDVQEAHDFALVAHSATLRSRIPFLHFFDGFRTSHEINGVDLLDNVDLAALVRADDVAAHKLRRMRPSAPVLRGTAQNPDVFFQAREASSPYHAAVPEIVRQVFDELAARTGRRYGLVDYEGHPDAERVIVQMGSGAGAVAEVVQAAVAAGERVGMLTVRLYRPFPTEALLAALPDSVRSIAVLDRVKEPGAPGEPLLLDVIAAVAQRAMDAEAGAGAGAGPMLPRVTGGRYGLGSKEFTPAMVRAVFAELDAEQPRWRFTVGIVDDVSGSSLDYDSSVGDDASPGRTRQVVLFALGSDGTVGASKASVEILGEVAGLHAQGYFVYDSKKSGSTTVSHLRFGPEPIRSSYLVQHADLVACHQFNLLEQLDVTSVAREGATLLLNAPHGPDQLWEHLPAEVRADIIERNLRVMCIDATGLARELKMAGRINTIMQPCLFALIDVIERSEAIAAIKTSIERTYARLGATVVERNLAAVDRALSELHEVSVPAAVGEGHRRAPVVGEAAPEFVQRVTAAMLAGHGDLLPVSAFIADGTFPTGTAMWEKRRLAEFIPVWEPDLCIDCGKCAVVCPHAVIRMKAYRPEAIFDAPDGFLSKPFRSRELDGHHLTIQVSPDDCTGCSMCVEVCPAKDKSAPKRRAINMSPVADHAAVERDRWQYFLEIPDIDRSAISHDSVKNTQLLEPLFEFSGACAGCGETPYLKLLTQLFGDHLVIANATGCSSIFGGNLPTTPWTTNADGRGPAWSNSLFEDNAEFGLGLRLGVESHQREAVRLVARLRGLVPPALADSIVNHQGSDDAARVQMRALVTELTRVLADVDHSAHPEAARLAAIVDELVPSSVWIVGGDGWAYDIGFGGVDHVLSTGRNVNLLVLDTEVYSNTGGQVSKATPMGAVAKFATGGKGTGKKDLGAVARSYGNVYVAQVAMGGSDVQVVKAMIEAAAWDGPSLIIAYSTCIAHGIDMSTSMEHQRDAVRSGYWPLYRYRPGTDESQTPFQLDSAAPSIPLSDFVSSEARFAMLARSDPERASTLLDLAQRSIDERWRYYQQLAGIQRTLQTPDAEVPNASDDREGT